MCDDPVRRRRLRAVLRHTGGATAAEFAMVLPVFLMILFGLWEFGWSQHCASSVRFALNQTAREVMLDPAMDSATVQSKVQARLTSLADPAVTVSMTKSVDAAGVTLATMTASYPHTFSVPGLGEFSFNYHSTVVTPLR